MSSTKDLLEEVLNNKEGKSRKSKSKKKNGFSSRIGSLFSNLSLRKSGSQETESSTTTQETIPSLEVFPAEEGPYGTVYLEDEKSPNNVDFDSRFDTPIITPTRLASSDCGVGEDRISCFSQGLSLISNDSIQKDDDLNTTSENEEGTEKCLEVQQGEHQENDKAENEIFIEEEVKHSERNSEIEQLSNLTLQQLVQLRKNNKEEIEKCKNRIAEMRSELHEIESEKCQTELSEEEMKILKSKVKKLREEEMYCDNLKERAALLEEVQPKYRPLPVDDLPKIIICEGNSKGLPKVVVVPRPKRTEETENPPNDELHMAFSKAQLEKFDDEKRWMDVTSGKLEMQIASLRGRVRLLNNENNVLTAVLEDETRETSMEANSSTREKSSSRKKEKSADPCFTNDTNDEKKTLTITISSFSIEDNNADQGEVRMPNNDNTPSTTPTPVVQTEKGEHHKKVNAKKSKKPCQQKKGKSGISVPCPKLSRKMNEDEEKNILTITISSTALEDTSPVQESPLETDNTDNSFKRLEEEARVAAQTAGTLKAQRDALRCLKASLQ